MLFMAPDFDLAGFVTATLFVVAGGAVASSLINAFGEPEGLSVTRRVPTWSPILRPVLGALWRASGGQRDMNTEAARDVARGPLQRLFVFVLIAVAAIGGAFYAQHARTRLAEYGIAHRATDPGAYIVAEALAGREAPCGFIASGKAERHYCEEARMLRSRVTPDAQALALDTLWRDMGEAGINVEAVSRHLAAIRKQARN